MDQKTELLKFDAYLRASMRCPEVARKDDSSRDVGSPFGFWVLSFLLSDFHLSYREAMAMPLIDALCLRAAHGEHTGQITLRSDRSRALVDYVRNLKRN